MLRGSGVATAGVSGVEAALVCVLRGPGGAMAVARVGALEPRTVTVATIVAVRMAALALGARHPVAGRHRRVTEGASAEAMPAEAMPAEAVPTEARRVVPVHAMLAEAMPGVVPTVLAESATTATVVSVTVSVTTVTATTVTATTVTAAAGERRAVLPAEGRGDLLEGGDGGVVVLGADGIRHRGPDAGGEVAEAFLGGAPLIRERPAVLVGGDPSALDEVAQHAGTQRPVGRSRSVDDVEQPPVSAGRALALEGGRELGCHEAVDGGEPVAEGAGFLCVLGGVHEKSLDVNVHVLVTMHVHVV